MEHEVRVPKEKEKASRHMDTHNPTGLWYIQKSSKLRDSNTIWPVRREMRMRAPAMMSENRRGMLTYTSFAASPIQNI